MTIYSKKKITDKIITVESPAQALRLLASGKHDCALLGNLQGFYLAKKLKLDNIKAIKSILFTQEYCFATKEGNDQLLSSLNEGLAIIKETGKYKEIYENWFGTLSAQHLIIKDLTKYGSIILLILTVGFLLALSWSRVLKIRVEEKTKELRKELLERMITEEKLRVSEERYRKLFESMLDGFILLKPVADKDGNINNFKIIEANTSFLKAVGKKKEEVVGKMLWDIFPTVYKSHIKVYEKVIETGRPTHFEIHSDETNKTFEIVGFTPQTGYFAAIVRDITQRKQAEKALKDNLEKIRKLHEIALKMEKSKSEEEVYHLIVEAAKKILEFDIYSLDIVEGNKFVVKAISEKVASPEIMEAPLNEGIAGKTFRTGKTIVVKDIANEPEAKPRSKEYRSAISIPIGNIGVFQTISTKRNAFSKEDVELAELLIFHATEAIERIRSEAKIKYLIFHDHLTGVYNRAFFEEELKRFDAESHLPLSIIMGDVNGLKLVNDAFGHTEGDRLLKTVATSIISSCRPQDIVARWGGDEFIILLPRAGYMLAERILKRIKMNLEKSDEGSYIPISVAFGIATKENADQNIQEILKKVEEQMYKNKLLKSMSTRNSIITSLEKMLLEKSNETEEHARRMRKIAYEFGKYINLTDSEINDLVLLAALHDIGKISVPESILKKPGPLTVEEWEKIKEHPETGYRIALNSPDLVTIADGILYHHEWWNGSGYPRGLKEEEIPFIARVISIIDAYDVMTSGRPYKKRLSKDKALEEIKKSSGIQFDPRLARLFMKFMQSLKDFEESDRNSDKDKSYHE